MSRAATEKQWVVLFNDLKIFFVKEEGVYLPGSAGVVNRTVV